MTELEQKALEKRGKQAAAGAVGGTALGIFYGALLFIVGLVLTFTIIGAIFGIPMMIVGLGMPFAGGISGALRGNKIFKLTCPYCNNPVVWAKAKTSDNCPHCRKRLIVRNGSLEVVQ